MCDATSQQAAGSRQQAEALARLTEVQVLAEKMRVHMLAKELGVSSQAVLEKCRAEGLAVKNHMSTLSAGLEATVREWFSEGAHTTTVETASRVDLVAIRRQAKKTAKVAEAKAIDEAEAAKAAEVAPPEPTAPAPASEEEPPAVAAEAPAQASAAVVVADAPAESAVEAAPIDTVVAEPEVAPAQEAEETGSVERAAAEAPVAMPPVPAEPVAAPPEVAESDQESGPKVSKLVAAAGPQNVPTPAVLQGPKVVRVEAPEAHDYVPRRSAARGPDRGVGRSGPMQFIDKPPTDPARPAGARGRRGRAPVGAEAARRANPRRSARADTEVGERLKEWRERDLIERQERLQAATGRGMRQRRAAEARRQASAPGVPSRRARAQVSEPITVRELCAATGISSSRVIPRLMKEGVMAGLGVSIETEIAELIAMEFGIELEVVKQRSAMDVLKDEFDQHVREALKTRPPVVTMLGHVDHGKTSLLDRIRKASVADGEAGGITQHVGAYQVKMGDTRVTFIDTPGHKAFTAMRARGAQMTDIVVLVVAADDGVMPQTVEAINHAKAAEVAMVVALNKIDLPGADLNRIYSQLSEHGVVPTEWGGDVDVIKTSAIRGDGIEDLLEHLYTMAELLELKADATVPARGMVVEASMAVGRGVQAILLVQDGTLKEGDIVVCGSGSGRVRAMRADTGKRIKTAEPSVPVTVTGLDALPEAGDRFYQVSDLKQAKAVAEERRHELRAQSLASVSKPKTLADLLKQQATGEVPVLSVIVRADVQGSMDVLKNQLAELPNDEVRLRILHAGVGAVTEGDVVLAQASSAIIIGFGVIADDHARRKADQVGVDIRLYRIIYDVTDDIKKALAGLLAPELKIERRGQASIREIFNITRVGTVAGCYVTDGTMVRNLKLRVVRDGVIVRDNAAFDSLKRFKDDVREVRAGMECGIKVAGFDDLKPGDVLEAYEVLELARTLD